MGYYCTVPQCTSLAGKTKNVKFHRFPRDTDMADKWNAILKRGKPYTKYSKVCSLHFTQADYNVTNMGQWKTLSKDAVPSQNLPKLHPDGSVMVIRKSRTLKYKDGKKDEPTDKTEKWSPLATAPAAASEPMLEPDNSLAYRLQTLHAIASSVAPQHSPQARPKKQDAFMQTDPIQSEEEENTQPNNSYSEASEGSFHSEQLEYQQQQQYKEPEKYEKPYEPPKEYPKTEDYIPQTNEEYNKEAEKYALGRKSLNGYDKTTEYQKPMDYPKMDVYAFNEKQEFRSYGYPNGYTDSAEILRNQQHNLQILQEQHRVTENPNFFPENQIKQEVELNPDEEKFIYDRNKEQLDAGMYEETQRRLVVRPVKLEPEACDNVMQPQGSPYFSNGHDNVQGYYEQLARPGPELLIAKQNALAAHTQLWQNTMKRPFFYSDSPHYNASPLLHRYEDIPRILQ